jgi:ribosomal protein S18 acetylase RimI-like enzyme
MAVTLRKPRENDAYRIAQVEIEVWRDTYPDLLPAEYLVDRLDIARMAALWGRRLQGQEFRNHCRVAVEATDGIVGFATFGAACARDVSSDGEIYELYVLTDYQNRGLGRRLCTDAAEVLDRQGAGSLVVEVIEGNPARFFYEALGAKIATRENRPFAGLRLPSLIYSWDNIGALLAKGPTR